MLLTIDFETRSKKDLRKTGVWPYAEHESTEIMCLAAYWQDKTYIWIPEKFRQKLTDITSISELEMKSFFTQADQIEAHNAEFEVAIYRAKLEKERGWPAIPFDKWRDSAAKAATCALPRDLKSAAFVIGLSEQKDDEGRQIMLKLSKPRKPTKHNLEIWHESPEDLEKLFRYCIQDVKTEHELSKALPDLTPIEQKIWETNVTINARGVYIDVCSVKNIKSMIQQHEKKLIEEFQIVTGDEVKSPKQVEQLRQWAWRNGTKAENLTASTVKKILAGNQPNEIVRRALEIRQELSKSSTAKYDKILGNICVDNRIRGSYMYHAASTGRFGGKGVQTQNLPRGNGENVNTAIECFNEKSIELVNVLYTKPMDVASACIRGMFSAPDGKQLICSDFSSIEMVVLAWLAHEEIVLKAFESGEDVYKIAASNIYKTSVKNVDSKQRQIGKIAVLALGFGGGAKAFAKMAKQYGVDITDKEAEEIKVEWRKSRPNTVRLWHAYERAAVRALQVYNTFFDVGNVGFVWRNDFLEIHLPSKRVLYYYKPFLKEVETPWGEMKKAVHFWAINSVTKKWEETSTHGGKLAENVAQAIARDLLCLLLVRLEKNGYPVVMHVHDEVVSEIPTGFGSIEDFEKLMTVRPYWCLDMPIQASGGWIGKRYRKG